MSLNTELIINQRKCDIQWGDFAENFTKKHMVMLTFFFFFFFFLFLTFLPVINLKHQCWNSAAVAKCVSCIMLS